MQKLYRFFLGWGKTAVRSIAFLPVPMMVAGFALGVGLYHVETNTDLSVEITESMPAVMIRSQETARTILSLFVGGLITLVVFTFTQMMALFSQVASSYSPRLLSQFTGDRALQFTMGFYLGTIIVTLIVLLSIRSDKEGYVPNVSVLFCIACGVISLGMFMYFTATISKKIQVGNIISGIYQRGLRAFKEEKNRKNFLIQAAPARRRHWYAIPSPIDGFIGTVNHDQLSELAKTYGTRFYIGTPKGEYVPKNYPLLESEKKLDEEQVSEVLGAVSPIPQSFDDWYLPPIQLLTEMALKAMSPGINDPGTAIEVIDQLTGLLGRMMHVPVYNFYQKEGGGEVWFKARRFSSVLEEVMMQLRRYCREDPTVCRRLFRMLFHLRGETGVAKEIATDIQEEILALISDVRRHIVNPFDRQLLAREIRHHRRFIDHYLHDTEFLTDPKLAQPGYE